MEIDKLKSFLALANAESFTKAAEELFISQPALSKQMQSLENELQVPLFNRSKRFSNLTIQGEAFKAYAENIVTNYINACEHIRQIEHLNQGVLHFGATHFIGVHIMPSIIAKFQARYPNIDLHMTIDSSKTLRAKMHSYQLEFALLSSYITIDETRFTRIPWLEDELKVVLSTKHPLSQYEEVSLEDLSSTVFISKNSSSSLAKYIASQSIDVKKLFPREMHLSQQDAIKHAVIKNLGFSFLSKRAIELEEKCGILKALSLKSHTLMRSICIVHEKNRYLTPAAKEFLKIVLQEDS